MKKLLVFLVLVIAGYFVYDNFIKEKEVYQINASYIKSREGVDLDAPAISPREFAHFEGKIKNISDKPIKKIIITYLIDAQESKSEIDKLDAGEEKNFVTNNVMLRHMDPAHYLKSVTFEDE
jgi:hypothetical protein